MVSQSINESFFTEREKIRFGKIDFLTPPCDCYPECLENDILNYETEYDRSVENYVIKNFKIQLRFEMKKPRKEIVLIHKLYGGGDASILAFSFLDLAPEVKAHIGKVVEKLGEYDAVHIRHSDYKTDYKTFLYEIPNGDRKIALCTDSYEVQQYAKSFFGDRVTCVSDIPDTGGRPLHGNENLDRYQTNLTALTDLFVLASAKNLYITRHKGGGLSGFGALAMNLNKRPKLVKRLIFGENREG
ncbi:MAG: hypothetical protein LBP89_06995 [Helicobacteraceae bacterium]|jgi:hypothetical protein|nr:hypothetical protein [Helicobacteraceae bacterium]